MKRLLVRALATLCSLIDHVPTVRRSAHGWHVAPSLWGCWPLRLAYWSDRLDQRWSTGVWQVAP